ncbi:Protein of unknown function (DUF1644 [Striga hermonthica]|uniref:Uncharacterized protein n=1 Tax=Striga hermonthica TaxID=68872 RepID=A0A9N7R8I1_STRHE|nr:Protein of unknown function (DUF1644 [Striga hermonthica]
MAKSNKPQTKTNSRSLKNLSNKCKKVVRREAPLPEPSKIKEWENALCSVCLESPHNAVLLLCTSYENGCRAYMCATSHRFSNCLEQYMKAYAKTTHSRQDSTAEKDDYSKRDEPNSVENPELPCPLCRGQVKGWTAVKPARKFLNSRKRNCARRDCSFFGTYKQIKKHVKSEHPSARPREVDPTQAEKWKRLEDEREVIDVLSTIRPGSIVIGDYVIENGLGLGSGGMFGWARPSFLSGFDGGPFGSRSGRRGGISGMGRLHARLLFGRQMGRL